MIEPPDRLKNSAWERLARRLVAGLDVQPGELIQVRGDPGSYAFLQEVNLAIELAGATPLPELLPGDYSRRLLTGASTEYLAEWDRRRAPLLEQVDRVLTFQRPPLDLSAVPREARQAWETATDRLIPARRRTRAAHPGGRAAVRGLGRTPGPVPERTGGPHDAGFDGQRG